MRELGCIELCSRELESSGLLSLGLAVLGLCRVEFCVTVFEGPFLKLITPYGCIANCFESSVITSIRSILFFLNFINWSLSYIISTGGAAAKSYRLILPSGGIADLAISKFMSSIFCIDTRCTIRPTAFLNSRKFKFFDQICIRFLTTCAPMINIKVIQVPLLMK